MDRVIMEELLRSVATFFLAFVITIFLGALFGLTTAPLYVIMGIPLVITGVVFSLFVYKRKSTGKEYKLLKRGTPPYKVMMGIFTLNCVGFILLGVENIAYGNTLMGLFQTGLGIFSVIIGFREFRKTK